MAQPNPAPINPLPWVVWVLALPIIAMEIVLSLADRQILGGQTGIGWRTQAIQSYGYLPELTRFLWANGIWALDGLLRFFTYSFIHTGFTHAIFAVVLLLALGKMVGEVFRWWAVILIFLLSGAVGAVIYTLVPGNQYVLLGGYPAVYGLIGAFTFLIWMREVSTGGNQARAFTMIGMLMGIQLLFGLLFGGGYEWLADLAGFATGFGLSFLLSPGGISRLMMSLRNR